MVDGPLAPSRLASGTNGCIFSLVLGDSPVTTTQCLHEACLTPGGSGGLPGSAEHLSTALRLLTPGGHQHAAQKCEKRGRKDTVDSLSGKGQPGVPLQLGRCPVLSDGLDFSKQVNSQTCDLHIMRIRVDFHVCIFYFIRNVTATGEI